MASILDTIRKEIGKSFKGKFHRGRMILPVRTAVDSLGDANGPAMASYSLEGFVDEYSLAFKGQSGIPASDVKILVFGTSLSATPTKDAKIEIPLNSGVWYQVRAVSRDPAIATWELQSFACRSPL